MTTQPASANDKLRGAQRWALYCAGLFVLACIVGWIFQPQAFYRAYLFSWLFYLGLSLGAMGFVMLHHLTGGDWGILVRRTGENAAMVLPLMMLLFIPIALGLSSLYPWADPRHLADSPILQHKRPYLNAPFFLWRTVIYGVLWIGMAWYLRAGSLRHDCQPNAGLAFRLHHLSAVGMLIYFVTMSLASVDWIMSREPHWQSTVFGLMVVCGQAVTGLSFLILLTALLVDDPPFRNVVRPELFNDLGTLLLTVVILWSYMAFVQLLVIWMANKQDEIPWYIQRLNNGWWWIGWCLILFHFFVPFIVLLMRDAKRKVPIMLALCALLLLMRALDNFWLVAPSGEELMPTLWRRLSWMDMVLPVGMGGVWLTAFLWLQVGHPLIPEGMMVLTGPSHGSAEPGPDDAHEPGETGEAHAI